MDKVETVYGNKSLIYGKLYSEWIALWQEWAYPIPKENHPPYDDYGYNCKVNQSDPESYFPGTFNHSTTKHCIVPFNVSVLFPILNTDCSYIEFPLKQKAI